MFTKPRREYSNHPKLRFTKPGRIVPVAVPVSEPEMLDFGVKRPSLASKTSQSQSYLFTEPLHQCIYPLFKPAYTKTCIYPFFSQKRAYTYLYTAYTHLYTPKYPNFFSRLSARIMIIIDAMLRSVHHKVKQTTHFIL